MYIQNYFKSGKPTKYKTHFNNIKELIDLLIEMNNGKVFKGVDNNFKRRDIVYDNGNKENMWEVMRKSGCSEKTE